jgi:hypothetical protein
LRNCKYCIDGTVATEEHAVGMVRTVEAIGTAGLAGSEGTIEKEEP